MLGQVCVDVAGNERRIGQRQKYPSLFFCSMEPASSWSIIRPWRSDVLASSISWITAGTVEAEDSTAPLNG